MRVALQFFGGGHAMRDAGKVHSRLLCGFCIHRTVADIERFGFSDV